MLWELGFWVDTEVFCGMVHTKAIERFEVLTYRKVRVLDRL
jgi:hypothetical protein